MLTKSGVMVGENFAMVLSLPSRTDFNLIPFTGICCVFPLGFLQLNRYSLPLSAYMAQTLSMIEFEALPGVGTSFPGLENFGPSLLMDRTHTENVTASSGVGLQAEK